MGMRDEGCNFDLTGLPLFYVNKIFSKTMDDGTVLVVCGLRNGANFTPLYATISPANVAMEDGMAYVDAGKAYIKSAH